MRRKRRACAPGWLFESFDCLQYLSDNRRHQRIVGYPHVTYCAARVHHKHRAATHAPETAVRRLRRVGNTELRHHLAIEVAQEWKRDVQHVGERSVCAVALDGQAKHSRPRRFETLVVLTERLE